MSGLKLCTMYDYAMPKGAGVEERLQDTSESSFSGLRHKAPVERPLAGTGWAHSRSVV
jgi:hypothetical protein